MQIREFGKPVTAKSLNESLAAKFGQKFNIERFTLEQLQDARNKIRTRLSQVETNESFDSVHNELYQKSKMMLDVLNAAISERGGIDEAPAGSRRLKEGEEDRAELVMAAKDMVDRITGWMEDTAEMQTESMLELADAIRDEYGAEGSEAFTGTVKPALDSLYSALEAARKHLIQGVGQLTGEADPAGMMGADDDLGGDMDMDPDLEGGDELELDTDLEGDDDFGADAAATGGEESGDRAKRESRSYSRGKKIAETILKKRNESTTPRKLASTLSKKK